MKVLFYTETRRRRIDAAVGHEHELEIMTVPLGAVIIIADAQLICGVKKEVGKGSRRWGWFYTHGWDGSYHDGHWYPRLVAWSSRGPHRLSRARRAMKKARAWYDAQPKADTSVFRFEARRQVREGD